MEKLFFFTGLAIFFSYFVVRIVYQYVHWLHPFIRFFLVGSITYGVVYGLAVGTDIIRKNADIALDLMNQLYVDTEQVSSERKYILIDIDNRTYKEWGMPLHMPRDKLRDILKVVTSTKPMLIVVDIDLAFHGTDQKHDNELATYIEQIKDNDRLIFMRAIDSSQSDTLRAKRFYFEDSSANLKNWAIPLFEADDEDFKIRSWKLTQDVTLNGAHIEHKAPQVHAYLKVNNDTNNKPVNPDDHQRIIYSHTYNYDKDSIGKSKIGYVRISAGDLLNADTASSNQFDGSIVIIGASHSLSHDRRRTPVGEMPGAMVILNAIKSMLTYGPMPRFSGGTSFIIFLALLVISGLMYSARSTSMPNGSKPRLLPTGIAPEVANLLALTIKMFFINIIFIPISFYILSYGFWSYIYLTFITLSFTYQFLIKIELATVKNPEIGDIS